MAIAPSRDGLVIAADSRLTFLGAQCDGAFKILTPARPARTVAVVTGDAVFTAPPPAGTSDLCGYLGSAPRLLDANEIVTEALEKSGDGLVRMADLSAACLRGVERFRAEYPAALRGYIGREIFAVVVASYDSRMKVSTLRRFAVRIGAGSGRAEAAGVSETKLEARDASDVWVYGEADWANRTVLAGAGRRFLNAATVEFLRGRKPIATVSRDQAAAAAANVIEAASRAAESNPPASGIGGEIHVMEIGSGLRAEPVAWPGKRM